MLMQAQFARESAKRMLDARRGKAPPTLGQKMGRGIMASATGWAVGGHIGGFLSGVIGGGLLGRLVRGTSIGLTRKMAMSVGDAGKRMARGIDTFLGGVSKAARSPFVPRTAIQVLKSTAFGPDVGETKAKGSALQKAFHQRYNEMVQTAASPPETKRRINEALIGVRMSDPSMADQLGELIMRRIGYIYVTMPKAPYPQNPFTKSGWTPSDAEIFKWTRCIEIAENPTAICYHMEDGTLTPEHVHALKEVSPQIYGEIQMDIVSRAAEIKAELPWAKRVTLSTLFEAPTDDILRPENVFLIQEAYSEQDTEKADQPKPQLPSTSTHNPTKAQKLAG